MRTRKQTRGGRPISKEDKEMLEDAARRRQRPPFRPPSKYASIPDINRKTIKATRSTEERKSSLPMQVRRRSPSPPPVPVPAQISRMPEPSISAAVPTPQLVAPPIPAPAPTLEDRIRAAKTVVEMVKNTDIPTPTIVNPNSKFVITTYWWGRGNLNRNVQHPCAAYINEDKKDILKYVLEYNYIKAIEDPLE